MRCAACQTNPQRASDTFSVTTYGWLCLLWNQFTSCKLASLSGFGQKQITPWQKNASYPLSLAILWGTKHLQLTVAAVFQTFGKIWERSVHSISAYPLLSLLTIKTWHWWGRLKTAPGKSTWHDIRLQRVGASCIVATPTFISRTQNSKLRACQRASNTFSVTTYGWLCLLWNQFTSCKLASLSGFGRKQITPWQENPSYPLSLAILWGTKQLQLTLTAVFQTFAKIWERSVHSISAYPLLSLVSRSRHGTGEGSWKLHPAKANGITNVFKG